MVKGSSVEARFVYRALSAAICLFTLASPVLADSTTILNSANGHSYKRFDSALTWPQASAACIANGAHLATITSQQEDDFIAAQFVQNVSAAYMGVWLGGTDELVEGTWRWITGEPWTFQHWNAGEPNDGGGPYGTGGEDYLLMSGITSGSWNDGGGPGAGATENLLSYVCEWENNYKSYPVGRNPQDLVFASGSIFVANMDDSTISKVSVKTGSAVTYPAGGKPYTIKFDGSYLWTANILEGTVSKLTTAGVLKGTYPVGSQPARIAYDGSSIWVTLAGEGRVAKLSRSTGAVQGVYNVGSTPHGILFDGTNIWVVNGPYLGAGSITKLSKTGVTLATFGTGGNTSRDIVTDGTFLYVSNYSSGTISKIRKTDGAIVNTLYPGVGVNRMLYEAHQLWSANDQVNTVTRFDLADDSLSETISFPTGTGPGAIGFDGVKVWSSNAGAGSTSAF